MNYQLCARVQIKVMNHSILLQMDYSTRMKMGDGNHKKFINKQAQNNA
jgi:hypothetical protein